MRKDSQKRRFEGKVYMEMKKLQDMRRKMDIRDGKSKEMCKDNVRKQKLTTAIIIYLPYHCSRRVP